MSNGVLELLTLCKMGHFSNFKILLNQKKKKKKKKCRPTKEDVLDGFVSIRSRLFFKMCDFKNFPKFTD